jgi:phosphoribosyl 1,2-cyclic phosphodiesterase
MKFIVLGSSSKGNCYILRSSSGEMLIIEAGVKLMELQRAINFDLQNIAGCIVSHSHNDHSGYIPEYRLAGINCFLNVETRQKKFGEHKYYNVTETKAKQIYQIGSFKVQPFELKHDVLNFGYLIFHEESGLFPFITDTHYCPFTFPGMNNILVEANYSDKIVNARLANDEAVIFVRNRVILSHMEIDTTCDFLKANDLSKVNNIVLIHLSEGNSNASEFKKRIQDQTGKNVHIAEPGLTIDFNKTSF